MSVDLSEYTEVPERIREFFVKYPDGSLACKGIEYRELPAAHLNGKPCLHVIYHAVAYRNPEDPKPGEGTASEPLPGLTPYTKGSEVMNAETSAWGRALVALGFVAKKVASAEEVRNRQVSKGPVKSSADVPSKKQHELIQKLSNQKGLTRDQLAQMVGEITVTENVEIDEGWIDRYLTPGRDGTASALIDRIMTGPIPPAPEVEIEPDTGTGEEFTHAPQDTSDIPWDPETAAA